MISRDAFPRLTRENHRITSPATPNYNCIAWSVENTERWWQPGSYWPLQPHPQDYGLGILVEAYTSLGFEECEDDRLEAGYDRVALYGTSHLYTHAARQQANGKWTSKLGRSEDIEHESPDDLADGVYGQVQVYMRRPIPRT